MKKIPTSLFHRASKIIGTGARVGLKLAGKRIAGKESFDTANFANVAEILVEELGAMKGAAMKAGQLLSMHGEYFFPPEVQKILQRLHSQSDPVSWEVMEKQRPLL